ncbi:hypothetical protein [Actinoplanes sp. NPDC051411]|uniref:hypothetical protein n=1 Tax=Actinoplanes sp. NPDC051411 TaxID=3155522 RepID=UPI00342323ED
MIDRLVRVLIELAARRWPGEMAREWRAELAVMRDQPAIRRLRFAVSLAVSPIEAAPRVEAWARSLAGAAGVVLLAGALANAAHVAQHRAGPLGSAGVWILSVLVVGQVARRSRASVLARAAGVGAALFGFLLAGNRVAVMPYMGWRDVLPAVLGWTVLTTLFAYVISRTRRRAVAVLGGLLILDLAAIAGSVRAAGGLGVSLSSAPAWFPLALLPGGTVTLGPPQASELLLANASAMIGPMLLCSVFVLTRALGPAAAEHSSVRTLARVDARTLWGVAAAIAALAGGEVFRRMPVGGFEATWHRLLDNSAVFGFGFLADTSGRVVTALVAGLIATHLGVRRRA